MKVLRHHLPLLATLMYASSATAEIKELNNTEMTEAFIKDGTIIIKQKTVESSAKNTIKIKVGAGTPVINEAEQVSSLNNQNEDQYYLLNNELVNQLPEQQFRESQFNQSTQGFSIPEMQSPAQQSVQQHAQNIVRTGLGLPEGTDISNEMMGQYLASFSGQSYGDALGAQQTVTPNGIQFSVPITGANFETGVFPSGDNSMNVETTNQQLLFNLFFPKE